jgi:hypothetical protein
MRSTRYVYHGHQEPPIISSVWCLLVIEKLITTFAETLGYMKSLPETSRYPYAWIPEWESADLVCGLLIQEMRRVPRSYYEHWMIHHMLRVMILSFMSVDIAKMWELNKASGQSPTLEEIMQKSQMANLLSKAALEWESK